MSRTYVTFLGRGRENKETGYRTTTYRFPDGVKKTTAFFGLALAEYIKPKPERVVILGTKGSQWGVLVENLVKTTEEKEARFELLVRLLEAETEQDVSQNMLDQVADLMCKAVGVPVVPRLIPFGQNEHEQYEILEIIAKNVKDGTVSLDLTHGFRHFGMIGFLSAFMLERIRELKVNDLWYGALDMTQDGITPVLKLDGLDRVQRWLNALSRFDATGDYGEFVQLLIEDGVPKKKAQCLKAAAFHERTLNLSASARQISIFLSVLKGALEGASGMFQKRLSERLAWARPKLLSEKQGKLARQYLKRCDYLRAALFAWEALVTRECEIAKKDPNNRYHRRTQEVPGQIQKRYPSNSDVRKAVENLNDLRNALAHGTPANIDECKEMLKNEKHLSLGLHEAFDTLQVGQ